VPLHIQINAAQADEPIGRRLNRLGAGRRLQFMDRALHQTHQIMLAQHLGVMTQAALHRRDNLGHRGRLEQVIKKRRAASR